MKLTQAALIAALESAAGAVPLAARALGVHHTTVYRALARWPDLAARRQQVECAAIAARVAEYRAELDKRREQRMAELRPARQAHIRAVHAKTAAARAAGRRPRRWWER